MKRKTQIQRKYFDTTDGIPTPEIHYSYKWETDFRFPAFPIRVMDVSRTDGLFLKHENYHNIAVEMVITGEITYTEYRKKITLSKGMIYIVAPHSNVRIENAKPGNIRRKLTLLISGKSPAVMCDALGLTRDIVLKPEDPETFERKIRDIAKLIRDNSDRRHAAVKTFELLLSLSLEHRKKHGTTPGEMIQLKNHIRNNIGSETTTEKLAKISGLTLYELRKKVKRHFGCTLIALYNAVRLEKAATLLCSTSLSIKSIAIDCGYGNLAYFGKVFKEYSGLTPSEYRSITSSNAAVMLKVLKNGSGGIKTYKKRKKDIKRT